MADNNQEKLEQALAVIESAKADLQPLLAGSEMILLGVNTKLDLIANQIRLIAGVAVQSPVGAVGSVLQPLTEFMGEPLNAPKGVEEADLTPEEQERKNFLAKVEKLEQDIDSLENEDVLEAYTNDQLVIRGLAKRAGLEDYREAELTSEYLDKIREGLDAKAAAEEQLRKDEEMIDGEEEE